MDYYNVGFTFNIPVAVDSSDESEVDAYYKARDEFPFFSVNEAKIKAAKIDEEEYNKLRDIVEKLHSYGK